MPSRYIWAPSEIPPKCKLQRLEKEQCVAEAEKFIAEFYRHKFIKPASKDYELNHVVDFRAAFPDRTCAFTRSTPAPVHTPSRRSSSIRSRGLGCFGRDRWNLWARRHNDEWICIENQLQTLAKCFQSMRENPWFHF